ncbi:MAG: transketolase [Bacteroidales bacterium]|nr:transketolase [Bacteroidales bacterium]
MAQVENLQKIASQVRRDIIRMVTAAGSGHPGGSLSSADIMTVLFNAVMDHDPKTWTRSAKNQDAFILSAGHLGPVYYSILSRCGYFPTEEMATLRKFGTRLQGHPCTEKGLPGIFQPSGSLGQGLSAAAGIALGKKLDKDPHYVYTLLGDGECEEGQIWEAAIFAANHHIDNLIAIQDHNNQQIDGQVSNVGGVTTYGPIFEACGWNVITVDGHDIEALLAAFAAAKKCQGKPTVIIAETVMGKGVDFMEGTCKWHGKTPSEEQAQQALAQLEETLGDY